MSVPDPLHWDTPIVDPHGRPTPEFIRKFNDQRANNDVTAADLAGKVSKGGDTMTGELILAGAPADPNGAATKDYVDTHSGGGRLSALTDVSLGVLSDGDDLTFDSVLGKWTNKQPTGGAGGTVVAYAFPCTGFNVADTGAFATLSNILIPTDSITVLSMVGQFNNLTIGNVYSMFIAEVNATTGAILSTVATAASRFTTTATGVQQHEFSLAAPVTLLAGHTYILALVITNGTGTSANRAFVNTSSTLAYDTLPLDQGKTLLQWGATAARMWYAQNSDAPTSGTPTNHGAGAYGLGIKYQLAGGGGTSSGREVLTANRTYFVATTGSDTNDGLTAGTPFATIQKAIDVACALDLSIFNVTIQVADGTYAAVTLKPYVGRGPITIVGNSTTPNNVVINNASGNAISSAAMCGNWQIQFLKLTAGGINIQAAAGSNITLTGVNHGTCGNYHMRALSGGQITIATSGYEISGGALRHLFAYLGGMITYNGPQTVTVVGTPNFSQQCAYAADNGAIQFNGGVAFTGAATGQRYLAQANGVIDTSASSGGSTTFFPGSVAGATATGGQYL